MGSILLSSLNHSQDIVNTSLLIIFQMDYDSGDGVTVRWNSLTIVYYLFYLRLLMLLVYLVMTCVVRSG